MHWEVDIRPRHADQDPEARRLTAELGEMGITLSAPILTGRIYLLSGDLNQAQMTSVATSLLADTTVERAHARPHADRAGDVQPGRVTVLPKPGVMDPAAESVQLAVADSGLPTPTVRTGRRYDFPSTIPARDLKSLAYRFLAN